jgi:ABC-type nickel/cobalt efflux system permease component RcnA
MERFPRGRSRTVLLMVVAGLVTVAILYSLVDSYPRMASTKWWASVIAFTGVLAFGIFHFYRDLRRSRERK